MNQISMNRLEKRILIYGVIPTAVVICLIASYCLGADANYDLLNYHFLNGYLYAHNAIITDTTSSIQSYLDPYISIFFYFLIAYLKPLTANWVIAFIQAFNLVAVFLIARELLARFGFRCSTRIAVSILLSLLIVIGPGFWSEIGTTMGDSILSVPILFTLYCVVRCTRGDLSTRTRIAFLLIAGLLVGFTCTMKLTNATFALALAMSVLLAEYTDFSHLKKAIGMASLFSGGVAIGFILTYAPLGFQLWQHFRDPVFPYFNGVFNSPYVVAHSIADVRWYPTSFWGYFTMPFQFVGRQSPSANSAGHYFGMEIPFRTAYFAILVPLTALYVIVASMRWKKDKGTYLASHIVVAFFVIGYILWALEFSYYRYLITLEILAPLVVAIEVIYVWPIFARRQVANLGLMTALLLISLYSLPDANWGRIPFAQTYFGINSHELRSYSKDEVVLGVYPQPLGFVVPYFPASDHFITLPSSNGVLYYPPYLRWYIDRYYKSNRAMIYVGEYSPGLSLIRAQIASLLEDYRLSIDLNACKEISTNLAPIVICPAKRI